VGNSWFTAGSIEFEWLEGDAPGAVTLTESFGSVRSKAPSPAASSFFGGYALEGRQRERLTQRRGISNPTDLYAMLREFGSSIAGAVTIGDPQSARRSQPRYEPISDTGRMNASSAAFMRSASNRPGKGLLSMAG
jgi:serine/threonine-protein kinase HipA